MSKSILIKYSVLLVGILLLGIGGGYVLSILTGVKNYAQAIVWLLSTILLFYGLIGLTRNHPEAWPALIVSSLGTIIAFLIL